MRIGVDAREIQEGVVTGIGRSLANFIKYFGDHEKHHVLVLFSEKSIQIDFHGLIEKVVIKKLLSTLLWDQVLLPMALESSKIDFFYSPYYKAPIMTRKPYVNQVLDLMYLVFPEYRKAIGLSGRLYYYTFGRAFSKKAVNIITDSMHAKSDIVRLWNINPEKIIVIPLGVAEQYKPVSEIHLLNRIKKKFSLPDKYILYLGNFKPHKNVKSLVMAFGRMVDKLPEYKLVLAGPLDKNGQKIKKMVIRENLIDKVIFTDTIRIEDHPEVILSMADLFVFPTLYEGFGLPPLEAMACGTPVITSNLTAVPEVIGDSGLMVDPENISELSNKITALLNDSEKQKKLICKGLERVKKFEEEKTAGEIYRHIINLLEI